MPRSQRQDLQRRCDSTIDALDRAKYHLDQMSMTYFTGGDGRTLDTFRHPDTDKVIQMPAYPEHVANLDQLTEIADQLIDLVKQFKADKV